MPTTVILKQKDLKDGTKIVLEQDVSVKKGSHNKAFTISNWLNCELLSQYSFYSGAIAYDAFYSWK